MSMSEEEALERSRRLLAQSEASVDLVSELIRRDQPDADENVLGGIFDAHGSASWAPQRDPKINWSRWGRWEAWEHCVVVEPGKTALSGDWVAWDALTGQQIGFGDKSLYSARRQAEMLAVYQNGAGVATRVVSTLGAGASALKFREVRGEIERRVDADTRAALRAEASAAAAS